MNALNFSCINKTIINCTGNATCMPYRQKCPQGDCELDDHPLSTYAKIRVIMYIIAFLLSLLGNGCVILVTIQASFAQRNISAFKLLIAHLAFVDLLFSCNILVLIPNEVHNAEAEDGLPMCTFKRMMRQVPLTVSIGTIAIIAIERYLGIAKDYQHRPWTLRRACACLVILWVISIGMSVPEAVLLKTTRGDVDCISSMSLETRKTHAILLIIFEYFVPLTIIAYCNYGIIQVLKTRRKHLNELQSNANSQRLMEQRKTCRILIAIVIGFAILALPNQMYGAYLAIPGHRTTASKAEDVLALLGILLLLHTSFNAAVYSIMDQQFREDAKKLCCSSCCIKPNVANHPSAIASSSTGKIPSKQISLLTSAV